MCGIGGIICWDERFRIAPGAMESMSARLAHRGPDARGSFLSASGPISPLAPQVGLVHRRLSILDLDPRADQPLADAQGRLIVFNGEIYNFRELRQQITAIQPDYPWRTQCDTEVLLAAYAVWGPDCLHRLNGMFAFAVWDALANRLFFARDRMGQKPLYFAHHPAGAFAFASELPALRIFGWIDTDIRIEAVADYLTWACTPRGTIFRGIDKLPPATWMLIEPGIAGPPGPTRYFNPNDSAEPLRSDIQAIARTRQLVLESVRRQLVADVPLGCFLSGGMDSSIIAAAMRHSIPPDQPLLTFSIGFDDPLYDETPYAAAVAKHIGSQHRQFIVRPDAAADLPVLARAFGEPFGDSSALPTHYLSRETRAFVKVALSGDGGDELFGGYDRYRAMAITQRLPRWALWLLRPAMLLPGTHPKSKLARLKRLLASAGLPPAERYAQYLRLFDAPTALDLLGDSAAALVSSSERLLIDPLEQLLARGRDVVQSTAAVDRLLYLPDDLLTKLDRCSMLHALEVRSPFLDHELVHFAAALPARQSLGKRLLLWAFIPDLPAPILSRKKMGFAVPIGQWLRTTLREMLHDLLDAAGSFARAFFRRQSIDRLLHEHESRLADHSERLYALLMLELWWKSR